MALEPIDERHAAQILAGTTGRNFGHGFEERLANEISLIGEAPFVPTEEQSHIVTGIPAVELLAYITRYHGVERLDSARAWWTGGLATSGKGDRWIPDTDIVFNRSKSDIIIRVEVGGEFELIGVGIKTCNNPKPTNAQLYFGTASSFCNLLRRSGMDVTAEAECAMRMFCGDHGYRPLDIPGSLEGRLADPSRWFWEELPDEGRRYWEVELTANQELVTRALLQFAYAEDPIAPTFLLHQRFRAESEEETPMAIFSIDELVAFNIAAGGFSTREYYIRKGTFRGDPSPHLAPRFGYIQFQRGGQKQHPTQLQFNLQAGYFNKIGG